MDREIEIRVCFAPNGLEPRHSRGADGSTPNSPATRCTRAWRRAAVPDGATEEADWAGSEPQPPNFRQR